MAVDLTPDGEVILLPESRVDEYVRAIGRGVIAKHRQAFDVLAAYDRGETPSSTMETGPQPPGKLK
ncbi:MAG: hypothetical protein ACYDCQ_16675 [Dehalococcoidia bacterium]